MYLSYGHHAKAAAIFERLLADNSDPRVRDRTWFFLAKIWLQRGYLDEAQAALDSIQGNLPSNLSEEQRLMQRKEAKTALRNFFTTMLDESRSTTPF